MKRTTETLPRQGLCREIISLCAVREECFRLLGLPDVLTRCYLQGGGSCEHTHVCALQSTRLRATWADQHRIRTSRHVMKRYGISLVVAGYIYMCVFVCIYIYIHAYPCRRLSGGSKGYNKIQTVTAQGSLLSTSTINEELHVAADGKSSAPAGAFCAVTS